MGKKCYICGSQKYLTIHHGVRGSKDIDVLKCDRCGLVWLSDFITDDEYYIHSGMRKYESEENLQQIRAAARTDDERRYRFVSRMIENKTVCDFGCGAGGFLHLAKESTKAVYGIELEKSMQENLIKEGIECFPSLEDAKNKIQEKIDILTAFHVLEHLSDPIKILNVLKSFLVDDGVMVIEVPNADDALLSLYQNEDFADFTYWEDHLYLYNNYTFSELMKKAGMKIRFLGQIQRYPLSNTMYWLAKGKMGGHKVWSMLSNETLDKEYEKQLSALGIADTIISVIEKE